MIAATLLACTAIDGDTVTCDNARIRLLGIDAPEMPGHCRKGRVCVEGDPYAAKAMLARGLRKGPVTFRFVTRDRYGRAVGVLRAGRVNLSCWQLRHGTAQYIAKWDTGGLVARECGR